MATSIRETHANQTKQIILETALRLFNEKTYSEVTVDEIIKEAGTSKGAFYHHFKSKDDLIIYEYSKSDDFYRDIYENELAKIDSAPQKLLNFVSLQAEHTSSEVSPEVLAHFLSAHLVNTKLDHVIDHPNRGFNSVVREIVLYGQRRGEFRDDLPSEEITNAIVRAIRGIHYDWALQNYDIVRATTYFFKYMFIPGIVTEKANFKPELVL